MRFLGIICCTLSLLSASVVFSQTPMWQNFTNGDIIKSIDFEADIAWIATTGGIVKYDPISNTSDFFSITNSGLDDNNIVSIKVDPLGHKIVTTLDGCYSFDNFNWRQIKINGESPYHANIVSSDATGKIWGFADKLYTYNGTWQATETILGNSTISDNSMIRFILFDKQTNTGWIGIWNALYKLNPNGSWFSINCPNQYFFSGLCAESGELFILQDNFPTPTFFHINSQNGWIDRTCDILPPNSGYRLLNVWKDTLNDIIAAYERIDSANNAYTFGHVKYHGSSWVHVDSISGSFPYTFMGNHRTYTDKKGNFYTSCKPGTFDIVPFYSGLWKVDDNNQWIKVITSNSNLKSNRIGAAVLRDDTLLFMQPDIHSTMLYQSTGQDSISEYVDWTTTCSSIKSIFRMVTDTMGKITPLIGIVPSNFVYLINLENCALYPYVNSSDYLDLTYDGESVFRCASNLNNQIALQKITNGVATTYNKPPGFNAMTNAHSAYGLNDSIFFISYFSAPGGQTTALYSLNTTSGVWKHYTSSETGLTVDRAWGICKSDNALWIIMNDYSLGKSVLIKHDVNGWINYGNPTSNTFYMISSDTTGNIWLMGNSSLVRFKDSAWTTYPIMENGDYFTAGASMHPSADGSKIWFTHYRNGILLFDTAGIISNQQSGSISGVVFRDVNYNYLLDSSDIRLPNQIVGNGLYTTATNQFGEYTVTATVGGNTIKPYPVGYFNCTPDSHVINLTMSNSNVNNIIFAYHPLPGIKDAQVDLTGLNFQTGYQGFYFLKVKNLGTQYFTDTLILTLDSLLSFNSANISPLAINGNTISWGVYSLAPDQEFSVLVSFITSQSAAIGQSVISSASLNPININDPSPYNNYSIWQDIVTSSFDPNDKYVSIKETTNPTDSLVYTIRFQNTGNDTAIRVVIIDTLDDKFDLSTYKGLSSSHPYQLDILNNHIIRFSFLNIQLPDSQSSPIGSSGFIKFLCYLKLPVNMPFQVNNTASIYFDFNNAIKTNTATTLFQYPLSTKNESDLDVLIYPNPTNSVLNFYLPKQIGTWELSIYNIQEQCLKNYKFIGERQNINISDYPKGIYIYRIQSQSGSYNGKVVKQ